MITRTDIATILGKCACYDPVHFPKPSDGMMAAWCEHFNQWPHLTPDDCSEAVTRYYNTPSRPVPQPADISRIARDIHQDVKQRWHTDPEETVDEIRTHERNRQRLNTAIDSIAQSKAIR